MDFLVLGGIALAASLLTFFTGFGLGTLLMPACALFMPVPEAVALTAAVHLVSGLVKFALTARHAAWRIVVTFGVPAVLASLLGAWSLLRVSTAEPWVRYVVAGREFAIAPVELLVGVLLAVFASAEFVPALKRVAFPPRWFPVGGALSGFFGGLAGMQGALRSAFLVRANLTKEQFVATGAAIACGIDLARLGVYRQALRDADVDLALLATALVAASAGAVLGSLLLAKVPQRAIERLVAALLFVAAAGLASGAL